jgi:hypothetical protein
MECSVVIEIGVVSEFRVGSVDDGEHYRPFGI